MLDLFQANEYLEQHYDSNRGNDDEENSFLEMEVFNMSFLSWSRCGFGFSFLIEIVIRRGCLLYRF